MNTYQITFDDGKQEIVKADSMIDALEKTPPHTFYIAKIEKIDRALIFRAVKGVNAAFYQFGYNQYHFKTTIARTVADTIKAFGFDDLSDLRDDPEANMPGDDGAIRCLPIGKGVYLCITWHKMPNSGKYEFVGYIS